MSALSDALEAAQRRALAAIGKSYVAGRLSRESALESLTGLGITGPVDTDYWFACLDVIREWGAPLPAEPKPSENGNGQATDAQLALIARLVKERNLPGPDLPITKVQAHEVIDAIKQGSYDPAAWTVPF